MSHDPTASGADDPEAETQWQMHLNRTQGWVHGLERGTMHDNVPNWAKGWDRDLWSTPGLVL